MPTEKQISWSKDQLKEIMDGSQKTRYKALSADANALKEAEDALLLFACAKKQAYLNAFNGKPGSGFGETNPDLLQATLVLQHILVDLSDIAMVPEI